MCGYITVTGIFMLVLGVTFLIIFYRGRAANAPDVAKPERVELMVLGALLSVMGFLLAALGLTGVICGGL